MCYPIHAITQRMFARGAALALALIAVSWSILPGHVLAHRPENGVYPTTKTQWTGCCHDNDCMMTYVEVVASEGDMRHVYTPLGNFEVHKSKVHQVTQPGAQEHICTAGGEVPQPDGGNILCVFVSYGMQ